MFNFESASFGDFAFSACGFGQDILAVVACYDWLSMAEHYIDFIASTASDVHKVWVGGGNESFKLVGILLLLKGGVKEVSVHLLLKY